MKNLIICEKPSLARNVCKGLLLNGEQFNKKDNYYESKNYIVIPVFGHLFSLYDINDYQQDYSEQWTLEQLPFVPDRFNFKLKQNPKTKKTDATIKKQFEIIQSLIHSERVASITHCGDSDREGEIIIRIVLEQAKNKKPVYRLWLPEQTEETIAKAIQTMKMDRDYDALANEGYARLYVDWLYGINYTRYATLKSGTLLRIGRVITPIVKIIYERDQAIKAFVPEKYYQLVSKEKTHNIDVELTVKEKYSTQTDPSLQSLQNQLNSNPTIVKSIEKKEKVVSSPKLFSQSDLQNYLSKKEKYSPSETLKTTQTLYENGHITYPRTPTNYLSENEKEKTNELIKVLKAKGESLVFKDTKKIFDNSKIESHSAIIPTLKFPNLQQLTIKEKKCYLAIYSRFCAVFCDEDHLIAETIINLINGTNEFDLKGQVVLQSGFLKYEKKLEESKSLELPLVQVGDRINTYFKPLEKQTHPPKHWTVETLNNYLKNPFRKQTDTEDDAYQKLLKGLEIGTEATRSTIIDNAITSEYIHLNKSVYTIAPKGEYLVRTIDQLKIQMDAQSTARLGSQLKDIYYNRLKTQDLIQQVKNTLIETLDPTLEVEQHKKDQPSLGVCPLCRNNVIENKKTYTCEDKSCRFVLWKDTNYITKYGKKKLTPAMVTKLLNDGKVKVSGLTSKNNKKYDCWCHLEIGDQWINIKPFFEQRK